MFRKENKLAYLTLFIILVVSFLLAALHLSWGFYVMGTLIGSICHYLMLKEDEEICGMDYSNPFVRSNYHPKKSAWLHYFLRMMVFAVGFVLVVLLSEVWADKQKIISVILALCGYITIKLVFIIAVQFHEKKVFSE